MMATIDANLLNYMVAILFTIFLVDTITTIIHVKSIKATLENIEKINSEIKEKLKEIKTLRKEKEKEEKAITLENMQEMIGKLKKKRNRILLHLYRNVYRLKKAFPAINTAEITEVLNQKITLRIKRRKSKQKGLK